MGSPPFIYASRSIIPSVYANAVQSANMACAFADVFVTFSAIFRSPGPAVDLPAAFAGFGLEPPRNVCLVRSHPLLDWSNLYLARYAAFLNRQPRDSLVYTRSGRIAWLACSLGLETVAELHDPLIRPYSAWLRRRSVRDPRLKLVATTDRLKADIIDKTGVSADRILVVGGAANTALLSVPALAPESRFNFNVGYAGSTFKGKGLEILVACASRLPDVGFHAIGASKDDCRAFGPAGENIVAYGRKTNLESVALLKAMDCLLLPNQRSVIIRSGADIGRHTSPLKMFEYMATGRPIIASDLPVLSCVLKNDVNALLCPPEDIAGFCARITTLRQNPDLARRLGSQARSDFQSTHTWAARARKIQSFISD